MLTETRMYSKCKKKEHTPQNTTQAERTQRQRKQQDRYIRHMIFHLHIQLHFLQSPLLPVKTQTDKQTKFLSALIS